MRKLKGACLSSGQGNTSGYFKHYRNTTEDIIGYRMYEVMRISNHHVKDINDAFRNYMFIRTTYISVTRNCIPAKR